MRQTESGRNAWKKCGFGGGSLFYKEGCRRKKMRNGQQVGEGSLCPWLGGNAALERKMCGVRAGDKQPEMGLGVT